MYDEDDEDERPPKFSRVTICEVKQDLTGGDIYCDQCNVRLEFNDEYFLVCPQCAEVKSTTYDDTPNFPKQSNPPSNRRNNSICCYERSEKTKFYERLFYLNEKVGGVTHSDTYPAINWEGPVFKPGETIVSSCKITYPLFS